MLPETVRIGTSGFSYGDWRGPFYPIPIRDSDMLSHYANTFNTVELTSTFYTVPHLRSIVSMLNKTPHDFQFCVKAHQAMTHHPTNPYGDPGISNQFKANLRVFQDAGKLGAVLLQYPNTFKPTHDTKEALSFILEIFAEFPMVVEFRNSLWFKDDALDVLRKMNVACCASDLPEINWSAQPYVLTPQVGYVRFYGRSLDQWRTPSSKDERYDYQYSEKELREWAPRIVDLSRQVERTYVFFNNCLKGRAVTNGKQLRGILSTAIRWE